MPDLKNSSKEIIKYFSLHLIEKLSFCVKFFPPLLVMEFSAIRNGESRLILTIPMAFFTVYLQLQTHTRCDRNKMCSAKYYTVPATELRLIGVLWRRQFSVWQLQRATSSNQPFSRQSWSRYLRICYPLRSEL
jgi:hypothetical protein